MAALGIIVGVIVGLFTVIAYFALCSKFAQMAKNKGYDKVEAFLFCLLLSVGGFLYVIALPNKNSDK